MRAFGTPASLPREGRADVWVVIDVLRASTTWTAALAAGARRVVLVGTPEEARVAAAAEGPGATWMAERGALTVAGAPLGNSPFEMTAERVAGKTLFACTSNGSGAVRAALERGGEVYLGSFLSFAALAARLEGSGGELWLLSAGSEGQPAPEDDLLAGALAARLASTSGARLDERARRLARSLPANLLAAGGESSPLARALGETPAGRHLASLGRAEDVGYAARLDCLELLVRARREGDRAVLDAE